MATLEAEVLDVRGTSLADTQPVQAEQHGQRGVISVVLLRGKEEHPELGAIRPASVRCVDLRPADVLGGVRTDEPVDVREPVAGKERDRSKLRLINLVLGQGTRIVLAADSMVVMAGPPCDRKTSKPAAINRRSGALSAYIWEHCQLAPVP